MNVTQRYSKPVLIKLPCVFTRVSYLRDFSELLAFWSALGISKRRAEGRRRKSSALSVHRTSSVPRGGLWERAALLFCQAVCHALACVPAALLFCTYFSYPEMTEMHLWIQRWWGACTALPSFFFAVRNTSSTLLAGLHRRVACKLNLVWQVPAGWHNWKQSTRSISCHLKPSSQKKP